MTEVVKAYGGMAKLQRWNVGRVKYKTEVFAIETLSKADEIVMEDTFQIGERQEKLSQWVRLRVCAERTDSSSRRDG